MGGQFLLTDESQLYNRGITVHNVVVQQTGKTDFIKAITLQGVNQGILWNWILSIYLAVNSLK
ncbi:hypothetical protein RINTHH_4720 [Richelia intracellularis HH01]|jgi:hypothetical protein|uniref:Uncharacterized protein n=1 Tax=Richelia intracellularis HH01 TaxID=1165094 RepID=M1WY19_9NOST|nr:hypothetical protein [Richelia intracellularis]CCH66627.1 hypothetical protein RINTHH_4720 [Richelia intracellularis HH01]